MFFRWFKLNVSKRIIKGGVIEATCDSEALVLTEQEDDCPECEVWQGTRMVGVVETVIDPLVPVILPL